MCKATNKKKYRNICNRLKNDYKYISNRMLSFFPKVWLTFILFAPIGLIKHEISFNGVVDFLLCFFGINNKINGTWWYISTYCGLMLQFPFINAFFNRYEKNNVRCKIMAIIGWLLTFTMLFPHISKISTIIFLEGYLIAKYSLFDQINNWCRKKDILGIVLLLGSVIIRCTCSKYASYNRIDLIIIVFFIYGVCRIVDKYPTKFILLSKIGNYSVYIWLSHAFYCLYYFQNIITVSRFSTIMFIETLILSLITAILLSRIEMILKIGVDKILGPLLQAKNGIS